ncbi:MAG: SPOR domain-containing protein [Bauldia sp.]
MDNRYSARHSLRPLGHGTGPAEPEPAPVDDPLVELARIVSGRPAHPPTPPRRRSSSLASEPGMSEADLARDLEAELLSDLQATLNAVRPEAPRQEPARTFGGTRYGGDLFPPAAHQSEPPADPYYFDAVPEPEDFSPRHYDPENLFAETEDAAEPEPGYEAEPEAAAERHYDPEALFGEEQAYEPEPEQGPVTGFTDRHYDPEQLFEPEPSPAPAPYRYPTLSDPSVPQPASPSFRPRALPRAVTDRALGWMEPRPGNAAGPAYNPNALAPERRQPQPPPQIEASAFPLPVLPEDPEPLDEHPFDAVARQSLDLQSARPAATYEWPFEFDRAYETPTPPSEPAFAPYRGYVEPEPELEPEPPVQQRRVDPRTAPAVHEQIEEPVHQFGYAEEDIGATPPRRGRWVITTISFLVFVALAATAMIFLRGGTMGTGGPPLITADTSPVRVMPEAAAAPAGPPEGAVVFNRLDEGAAPIPQTMLPATEAPTVVEPPVAPADGITELIGGPVAAAPPARADEPRSVRTVTVLPDGTIVNNQVLGANGQPTAPANQGADAAPAPAPAALNPPAGDPAVAALPAPDAAAPAGAPAAVEAAPLAPAEAAAVAPAAAEPAAGPIGAGQPIPPGIYVQLSSQTTEAAALADIREFEARLGNLVDGLNAVVQTGVVNGIERFRSQFGPVASEGAANTLCASIRAAGLQCIIARNN